MIRRLVRDATLVCLACALVAAVWRPHELRVALGVLGGGLLAGLSLWAIRSVVDQVAGGSKSGQKRPGSAALALVKFFTRHVIIALVAYGMMVRLQLDPVGMIVGVTSATVAAGIEAARRAQK